MFLIIVFFVAIASFLYFTNTFAKASYNGFYTVSCIDSGKKPVRDYSLMINISVLGKDQQIPKDFGHKENNCLNEIYVDNSSGVVNVKTNEFKSFTLGNFFNVWDKRFNKDEVLGNKVSKEKSLEVYVNGIRVNTYENTPLFPDSRIEIVYK